MAVSIDEQYPGQTAGTNTNYPLGQARNVTTPGDGTGTPWDQTIVNDDQGFKQAILKEAGITPSGVPDTAPVSQYLQGLKTLFLATGAFGANKSGRLDIPFMDGSTKKFLKIKWGNTPHGDVDGVTDFPITFPAAFTECFGVLAIETGLQACSVNTLNVTAGGFTARIWESTGVTFSGGIFWIAVGR